jgi:hypothetical protein
VTKSLKINQISQSFYKLTNDQFKIEFDLGVFKKSRIEKSEKFEFYFELKELIFRSNFIENLS